MKIKNYESPKFEFQEMLLLERVADVCWGQAHYAWYDANQNGEFDEGDQQFYIQGSSCNDARLDLEQKLLNAGLPFDSAKDTKENINSPLVKPIYSNRK